MFENAFEQQSNGVDHKLPPRGNTDPKFSSVLPSTSVLELVDNLTQAQLVLHIRELPPPKIFTMQSEVGWIVLGQPAVAPANVAPTTTPAKAKDLELAGEVALFREIVKDWGLTDEQASAVLGYKEPTFATDLFKGLTSIRQRDAEERLQHIITIAVDLEALYQDYGVIQKWLRKPHELLNGATPLVMATEGTSVDLLKLSEYVEYLSGR